MLLTDTVGFIRKLPHTVIESFKATLEEVALADLLIHVVDLSHPHFHEQMAAVDATIRELDAQGKQTMLIFNKIDAVADPAIVRATLDHHPGSVAISARTGEGMDTLIEEFIFRLSAWRMRVEFFIPLSESAPLAELHRVGHVLSVRYDDDIAVVTAHVPPELRSRFAAFEAAPVAV
jgi:GTP-binding protein HflX